MVDCFAAFLPKVNRLQIIQTIGTLFNMNNQEVRRDDLFYSLDKLTDFQAEFYAFKSMTEFDDHDKEYFSIGHVKLEIQKK